MPYLNSKHLPGERTSRSGHREFFTSALVSRILDGFRLPDSESTPDAPIWTDIPNHLPPPLEWVVSVDGSIQVVESKLPPHQYVAFVKTALVQLPLTEITRRDAGATHPAAIQNLLESATSYHTNLFPLRNLRISNISLYDATRQLIFDAVSEEQNGELHQTLKWLAYEKWSDSEKRLPFFQCPHCQDKHATLSYDNDAGICQHCGETIYITDMLGWHLEMLEDTASLSVPTAYMNIVETLMLFNVIRRLWQDDKRKLKLYLFIKDGPLQIRAQYSKLVNPIRRFILHAQQEGIPIHLVGQEKTGQFVEHLQTLIRVRQNENDAPVSEFFIPDNTYIHHQVKEIPVGKQVYGYDSNYGAKFFCKLERYHHLVLSMPTDIPMKDFLTTHTSHEHLIGFERIMSTLQFLLSHRHENGLLPIEIAHAQASLSTYPSAEILGRYVFDAIESNRQIHSP